MVTGITRQVIVVEGTRQSLFDQAIFLVRDEVLQKGGVSEDALLRQVRQTCHQSHSGSKLLPRLFWSFLGAGVTGCLWGLTYLLL